MPAICSYMFPDISEFKTLPYTIKLFYFMGLQQIEKIGNFESKKKKINFNLKTPYSKF